MDDDSRVQRERAERERYRRGLPDHHDPTAGIGGAPPAYSALTLRLVLAGFGLLFCTMSAAWLYAVDGPLEIALLLLLLGVVAAVDLVVIIRRKRRGEPG